MTLATTKTIGRTEQPLRPPLSRWWRRIRLLAFVAGLAMTLGAAAFRLWRTYVPAPLGELTARWNQSTQVLAKDGTLLRDVPSKQGVRGQPMPLASMGHRLVVATLVSEDERFFDHGGVDAAAITRALEQNLRHGRLVSGGSTVTQQLAKLLVFKGKSRPRTFRAKLIEAGRAANLDEALSKEQILEHYLNRLNYGRGLVGPMAAARGYFRVTPENLTWAQAALLSVLPRAPSAFDPIRHPERAIKRQRQLLERLAAGGFLTAHEVKAALASPPEVLRPQHPFEAPHLMAYLEHDGKLTGGEVRTSIDSGLQRDVQALVAAHIDWLRARQVTTGAAMVVNNANGEVLAYVGGPDFSAADGHQIDMLQRRRQPGSTLKPIVYGAAFEQGVSPDEWVADVPFSHLGEGGYRPMNFDHRFVGPIAAREALALSLNVPAVRLLSRLGPDKVLKRLRRFGLRSLHEDADHYGLSLALGSGEVTPFEVAAAFSALSRGGVYRDLTLTVDGPTNIPTRVMTEAAAAFVTDALSDPIARLRSLQAARAIAGLNFPVAIKTGTSSGYRDSWTAGYTSERTVVVWLGNADNSPTEKITGGGGAGPLFGAIIERAMEGLDAATLVDRSHHRRAHVCKLSGKPAASTCPHTRLTWVTFQSKGEAKDGNGRQCDIHRRGSQQPGGIFRCHADGAEVAAVAPAIYDSWLSTHRDEPGTGALVPHARTRGCAKGAVSPAADDVQLRSPADGTVWLRYGEKTAAIPVEVAASRTNLKGQFEVRLDGVHVWTGPLPISTTGEAPLGAHELTVRPVDPAAPISIMRARISVR